MNRNQYADMVEWGKYPLYESEYISSDPAGAFQQLPGDLNDAFQAFLKKADSFIQEQKAAGLDLDNFAQKYELRFSFDDSSRPWTFGNDVPFEQRLFTVMLQFRQKR